MTLEEIKEFRSNIDEEPSDKYIPEIIDWLIARVERLQNKLNNDSQIFQIECLIADVELQKDKVEQLKKYGVSKKAFETALANETRLLQAEVERLQQLADERNQLLFIIENKYQGESRFDTALRFLKERTESARMSEAKSSRSF